MTLWILTNLILASCATLTLSHSPLSSGLLILLIAISLATLYALLISSWFAFLIFLIYIGGILVIFSYFVALTPNQKKISLAPIIPILLTILILTTISPHNTHHLFLNHHISSLYWPSNTSILILLSLLLLLAIIIIVNITNLIKGPLRPFTDHPYVQTYPHHSPSH